MDGLKQNVIVMAGGHGIRMGPLAQQYGCKSLIPIGGNPAIEYVIRALISATVAHVRIFLCIERPELYSAIRRLVQKMGVEEKTEIYLNPNLKGTMHSLYLLRDELRDESVFVLYGHQPIDPKHIVRMMKEDASHVIVTLYETSSNVSRKIAVVSSRKGIEKLLRGGKEKALKESQFYIDVPYRFPMEFVKMQGDEYIRSHEAVQRWLQAGHAVKGRIARFPHEFHYAEEMDEVARFAQRIRRKLDRMTA